jgi:hypothetical protein
MRAANSGVDPLCSFGGPVFPRRARGRCHAGHVVIRRPSGAGQGCVAAIAARAGATVPPAVPGACVAGLVPASRRPYRLPIPAGAGVLAGQRPDIPVMYLCVACATLRIAVLKNLDRSVCCCSSSAMSRPVMGAMSRLAYTGLPAAADVRLAAGRPRRVYERSMHQVTS